MTSVDKSTQQSLPPVSDSERVIEPSSGDRSHLRKMKPWQQLLLGGVLPIAAFTLVEQIYGTWGGLIAGLVFGLGEVIFEFQQTRRVQAITWISTGLILVLGSISLLDDNPVFFKLQPAILTFVFAIALWVSHWMKKPLLLMFALKTNPHLPPHAVQALFGMNFRFGFVALALGLISVHAAYQWSTAAWAILKAVGFPVALVLFMLIEVFFLRRRIHRDEDAATAASTRSKSDASLP